VKEIVVLSGKGGTGKTMLTASFACLAEKVILADADVDAANLALVLPGVRIEDEPFVGGQEPVRDESLCDRCELCRLGCRFGAIGADLSVDRIACEGCGLCSRLCPFDAIAMVPRTSGRLFVSRTARGPLVHARLEPGEESSGKLVSRVRQRARTLGAEEGASFHLVAGPPGIGCPAISALGGADLAVLVAQPGVSGLHDLERVLDLTAHFGVRA
jgi:MinD superfamily P-loop ATPase